MKRSVLARVQAIVMAAAFACAAIVLPDLDAVIFHGTGSHETKPHIEAADAPACHAENCALGVSMPQGHKPDYSDQHVVRVLESVVLLSTLTPVLSSGSCHGSVHSRAPPASFVS